MFKNITHIYFDLDHTIWDFETNSREALNEIFEKFELSKKGVRSAPDFIKVYEKINHKMWDQYRKGTLSKARLRRDRFPNALLPFEINDDKLANDISEYYIENSPRKTNLFDNAHSTLEYLNKKYELHVITNGFEEIQKIKMEGSNLTGYFKEVITSEMVGVRKPDIKIFKHALEVGNVNADEAVMIGDDLEVDVLGAQNSGMKGIYFNPNKIVHNEIISGEISNLDELKSMF